MQPFDLEQSEAFARAAKRVLRRQLRVVREALPVASVRRRSDLIVTRLLELPVMLEARSVALYAASPARREVDLASVDDTLRSRGVILFYPFMDQSGSQRRMGFRRLDHPEQLQDRGHHFSEPDSACSEAMPGEVDVVVVPALAVTEQGARLGFGSGFYDQVLLRFCPPATSIVVAYDFQLLAGIPEQSHDVRCDFVVTDRPAELADGTRGTCRRARGDGG